MRAGGLHVGRWDCACACAADRALCVSLVRVSPRVLRPPLGVLAQGVLPSPSCTMTDPDRR
eukprot:2643663-Alexandrium_andersonii.AAC.1